MFPLPDNFVTDIIAYMGTIFEDLSPLVILIISVLLAFIALEILLGILRK